MTGDNDFSFFLIFKFIFFCTDENIHVNLTTNNVGTFGQPQNCIFAGTSFQLRNTNMPEGTLNQAMTGNIEIIEINKL